MEIKICTACKGYGKVKVADNHSPIDTIPCSVCKTTGRVYYRSYELILPFGEEKAYYRASEEIINTIRTAVKCQK